MSEKVFIPTELSETGANVTPQTDDNEAVLTDVQRFLVEQAHTALAANSFAERNAV
jgi:hypothetical protein